MVAIGGVVCRRRPGTATLRQDLDDNAELGHEGSIVVQRVKEMKGDQGFNAQTEQYEDLVEAG